MTICKRGSLDALHKDQSHRSLTLNCCFPCSLNFILTTHTFQQLPLFNFDLLHLTFGVSSFPFNFILFYVKWTFPECVFFILYPMWLHFSQDFYLDHSTGSFTLTFASRVPLLREHTQTIHHLQHKPFSTFFHLTFTYYT